MSQSKEDKPKKKKGGARPGAGRKPKIKKLSNYEKVLNMMDEALPQAMQIVIDGLSDPDKQYRMRCTELLFKKCLPDRKDIVIGNSEEMPINIVINGIKTK